MSKLIPSLKSTEHIELWQKIMEFNFDQPGTVLTFAEKVDAQNKWPAHFAHQVIMEYRKFIFLCCISPTGAAPSKKVDIVWHLHLTYTQSYWIDLCGNTLGRDLHHNPSKGGKWEEQKHNKWHEDTLVLYKETFEQPPPVNIWPPPKKAVDIPRSLNVMPGFKKVVLIFLMISLPFLFIYFAFEITSPFDLNGLEFLWFYFLLCAACAVSLVVIGKDKTRRIISLINDYFPTDVTAFQLADFLHGPEGAVDAAILDLVNKGVLKPDNNKTFCLSKVNLLPGDQNPFIKALLNEQDGRKMSYGEILPAWYQPQNFTHAALKRIKKFALARPFLAYLPVAIFLIGIARIFQGIFSGYPVVYLLIQVLVFVCIAGFIMLMYSGRETVNREVRWKYTHFLSGSESKDLVMRFVLQGRSAFKGEPQETVLNSVFLTGYIVGNSGSGSDGGSGGGGGDGGGDGGGGGCGGCGGGG